MKRITITHSNPDKAIKQVSRYFGLNPNRKQVRVHLFGKDRKLDRDKEYYKVQLRHILTSAQTYFSK